MFSYLERVRGQLVDLFFACFRPSQYLRIFMVDGNKTFIFLSGGPNNENACDIKETTIWTQCLTIRSWRIKDYIVCATT